MDKALARARVGAWAGVRAEEGAGLETGSRGGAGSQADHS